MNSKKTDILFSALLLAAMTIIPYANAYEGGSYGMYYFDDGSAIQSGVQTVRNESQNMMYSSPASANGDAATALDRIVSRLPSNFNRLDNTGLTKVGQSNSLSSVAKNTPRWNLVVPANIVWETPLSGKTYLPLSISDGVIYVGIGRTVTAFSEDDGSELWNYSLECTDPTLVCQIGTPVTVGTNAYFGTYDNKVYALDLSHGKQLWSVTAEDNIISTPAYDEDGYDDVVYFGAGHGDDKKGLVYAVYSANGKTKWKVSPSGSPVYGSPTVSDNVVYIGSDDRYLYALNADDGSVKWKYPTDGWVRAKPAISGNTIYVTSFNGTLYALDSKTGDQQWAYWAFPLGIPIGTSPTVEGDRIYYINVDGWLEAVFKNSGHTDWAINIPNAGYGSPVVSGRRVFIGTLNPEGHQGNILEFDTDTGNLTGRFEAPGSFINSIAAKRGIIYAASFKQDWDPLGENRLYALSFPQDEVTSEDNACSSAILVLSNYDSPLTESRLEYYRNKVVQNYLNNPNPSFKSAPSYVWGSPPCLCKDTKYFPELQSCDHVVAFGMRINATTGMIDQFTGKATTPDGIEVLRKQAHVWMSQGWTNKDGIFYQGSFTQAISDHYPLGDTVRYLDQENLDDKNKAILLWKGTVAVYSQYAGEIIGQYSLSKVLDLRDSNPDLDWAIYGLKTDLNTIPDSQISGASSATLGSRVIQHWYGDYPKVKVLSSDPSGNSEYQPYSISGMFHAPEIADTQGTSLIDPNYNTVYIQSGRDVKFFSLMDSMARNSSKYKEDVLLAWIMQINGTADYPANRNIMTPNSVVAMKEESRDNGNIVGILSRAQFISTRTGKVYTISDDTAVVHFTGKSGGT
jgi:outer membrane protein assembly factor BamB